MRSTIRDVRVGAVTGLRKLYVFEVIVEVATGIINKLERRTQ